MNITCGSDIDRQLGTSSTLLELCGMSQNLILVLSALKKGVDLREKYSGSIDKSVKQMERVKNYLGDLETATVLPLILKEGESDLVNRYFLLRAVDLERITGSVCKLRDRKSLLPAEIQDMKKFYNYQQEYCLRRL